MRHKLLGTILSLLMVCSVISIGFATWSIVNVEAFGEATGDIHSEDIIKISDYLYMPEAKPLEYNRDGFIGDDKYNSSIDCIGYRLHVKQCVDKLRVKEIQVQIKLNYVDLKPTNMNIFEHITPVATHNGNNIASITNERTNIGIITTITISGEDMKLVEYDFNLIYKFSLDSSYFNNNNNSPLWTKSQPVFKMSAVLLFK